MTNEMAVTIRNEIVSDLYKASGIFNKSGEKKRVVEVLGRILRTEGYSIDLDCEEKFYSKGKYMDIVHVKISENDGDFVIRVYMSEDKKVYLDYDHYMLRTDEENRLEAEAEIEAERGMSLWASGYRPHLDYMDDPRGY